MESENVMVPLIIMLFKILATVVLFPTLSERNVFPVPQ